MAHTHETPVRNHPVGRDLPTRGHIVRGAGTRSHDDADSGAKVEYRTSSTPAYTDGLDLHHSTNNTPTTTRGCARLRIADNIRCTNYWCLPTKVRGATPHCGQPHDYQLLGSTHKHPFLDHTPHCGQSEVHQQWVNTHESHPIGALVNVGVGDFLPRQIADENGWIVNVYESRPREHPHCGQHRQHQRWVNTHETVVLGPHPALRTTTGAPTMGATHETRVPATLRIADNS